jgi:hypothetical protein
MYEEGYEYTCEDFALKLLIEYAAVNNLPLQIKNGSGVYDPKEGQVFFFV